MSRILDIHPDEEADVINRVVMQVHRYIDEQFPSIANPSTKFSKTVFNSSEDTVVDRMNVSSDLPSLEGKDASEVEASPRPATSATPQAAAPVSDVHEFAVSQHADLEFSKKDQLPIGKKSSTAAKTLKLILLIVILTGICAYWAYDTLLP